MIYRLRSMITIALILAIYPSYFASANKYVVPKKSEILTLFKESPSPCFHLNTGMEWGRSPEYLKIASRFSVHYYKNRKDKLKKGANFLVTLVKEDFFYVLKDYKNDFREILGDKYDEIISRLKAGENFYYFEKGSVNKLILCAQDEKMIIDYFENLFKEKRTFNTDAVDIDNDGLPDYLEEELEADKYNKDTDGDGLSDYEEYCKYRTHMLKPDSDRDGIPDGDWNERREFTYTIRAVREIYPPFKSEVMNDLFQDIKVLDETKEKLKYEIILYPEAINMVIPSSKAEEEYREEVNMYRQPSFFCNFSSDMCKEIKKIVNEWQVENNYKLLEYVADYTALISKTYPKRGPFQFYIEAVDGELNCVYKGRVEQFRTKHFVKIDRVLDHLAFGEGMYKNRMHGTCSSIATYMATIYRAAGFPARIISTTPIINFSDSSQVELLKKLKNEKLKKDILDQAQQLKGGFVNHFFNEIFINGRWIRCDYSRMNVGCIGFCGPLINENTFADFGEEDYARTWGERFVEGKGNPYNTLELSDQYPIHTEFAKY